MSVRTEPVEEADYEEPVLDASLTPDHLLAMSLQASKEGSSLGGGSSCGQQPAPPPVPTGRDFMNKGLLFDLQSAVGQSSGNVLRYKGSGGLSAGAGAGAGSGAAGAPGHRAAQGNALSKKRSSSDQAHDSGTTPSKKRSRDQEVVTNLPSDIHTIHVRVAKGLLGGRVFVLKRCFL